MQYTSGNGNGIILLWYNWIMATGALTLLIVLSLWTPPLVLPMLAFGMQLLIFAHIRRNRESDLPACYLLPFVVSRILFWSAIVMMVVNILYSQWIVHHIFDITTINREIPFICQLIVSPVASVITLWAYVGRQNLSFCKDCRMRHGSPAERGFFGVIFSQEGQYQLALLCILSIVCTIVGWTYYAMMYINTDINSPDRFIFFLFPTLLWLAAAIYVGIRYMGIWAYYHQSIESSSSNGNTTRIRFIVIWDNYICLRSPAIDSDKNINVDTKFDTPISASVRQRDNIPMTDIQTYFTNLSGIENTDLRFMYSNVTNDSECNILHYFSYLTDEQKEAFTAANHDCDWYTIRQIQTLLNKGLLNPMLSAEITRLHTIAMAWKTYTPSGHRRYKIKRYTPSFRISDIKNWDVDYNDSRWLYVADNNEDVPLFNLRRFWRKYINGIG